MSAIRHLVQRYRIQGMGTDPSLGWLDDLDGPKPRMPTASRRVASRFKQAVIRKEDGQFCVRSPDNSSWNGGCYDTEGEAEKRLEQVEYFKDRQAREIPLDKRYLRNFVTTNLVPKVTRWLQRQPQNEPIGPQSIGAIARDTLVLDMSDRRESITVTVAVGAQASRAPGAAVLGGAASQNDRVIALYMNGAITPESYLSEKRMQLLSDCTHEVCLPYGLFSILIHEATHVVDRSLKKLNYSPREIEEKGESAWGPYVNDPSEIRAFMQQVVDEAVRSAGKLKEHFSGRKLVDVALRMSTTWSLIEKHLNPSNKARILKAVYQGLAEAELV